GERVHSFKMGWCIDCHRLPPEEWRTDGRETRGPIFCSTCHR
ncbi:MAG: cytochrome C, partial [Deltaproteobacteria bacterium]|nr:cytochrome C [Deltaproteobacteria bacterium]